MEKQWKILLYKNPSGNFPVRDFIDNLELKTRSKVRDSINLLKNFGIAVGLPHVKKLTGTDLWELRILRSDSMRVFYVTEAGKTFLLLHGFKKKKNKTPPKEIKIAEERLAEHKSRR